ncbi:Acg family FMN-binding oxidoreductase [Mycobacterium sp. M23085]|uniref:Acg family FMN-binding oxidoreductase n=1 Tax=Mycobacterium sp. M23085 TaxID=3378087 RepID=UPI0038782526
MHSNLDIKVLRWALLVACRAPSMHNSQPWRWVLHGARLRLFVDRYQTVPGADQSGRETLIGCGAVLDHLRVAMLAAGWQAQIERFPDPHDPENLASVEFSPVDGVTDADRLRAGAILQRRTDRLPLGRPTYWGVFEPVLRSSIGDRPVTLDVLSDDVRPQLVEASRLTEAIRRDDWSYHAELDWWTSPFVAAEGIPVSSLASDKEHYRVDVGREFPIRSHEDRRPEVSADWSKILVLSTAADTRVDALRCGEALSTVLLECTVAGMATCTLTHLIEVDESRNIVRSLISQHGEPQVVIRAGIAPLTGNLPAPTPRRPLDEVLEICQ